MFVMCSLACIQTNRAGPDGMNPAFFQKFWHIVGGDVTAACLNFIDNCEFSEELNAIAIVLIPKKSKPEYLAYL